MTDRKEQTTIRLPAELKKDLDYICLSQQISLTELITRAIKNIIYRVL